MTHQEFLLAAQLFHALLGYHSVKVGSTYKTENRDEQKSRLATIATATVEQCSLHPIEHMGLVRCVGIVATTAKWESGLLQEIHSGKQRGPAGELCLVQLHRQVVQIPHPKWRITHDEWLATPGLDYAATSRCIGLGVRVHGWHAHRCWMKWHDPVQGRVEREFAEYWHPNTGCSAIVQLPSILRAESWRELDEKLRMPVTQQVVDEYRAVVQVSPGLPTEQ